MDRGLEVLSENVETLVVTFSGEQHRGAVVGGRNKSVPPTARNAHSVDRSTDHTHGVASSQNEVSRLMYLQPLVSIRSEIRMGLPG